MHVVLENLKNALDNGFTDAGELTPRQLIDEMIEQGALPEGYMASKDLLGAVDHYQEALRGFAREEAQ